MLYWQSNIRSLVTASFAFTLQGHYTPAVSFTGRREYLKFAMKKIVGVFQV